MDVLRDYPEYVPDLENYVAPNCSYVNVEDLHPFICSLSLCIFMLNIRSCKKNFDNFLANFFTCIKYFSCIIFTETWLSPNRDKIFDIPGFYCQDLYRNHYGGGIKVYLKDCIKSKILNNFTVMNDLLELLTIELIFYDFKCVLMTVYHPPTSCPQKNVSFVDLFTSYLRNILNLKLPVIVAGDINLNLLNPNGHPFIDMYINNLLECGMRPLITKPTKVNLNNPITQFSIIDQIWVSNSFPAVQPYILPVGITDHFPVCIIVSSVTANTRQTKVKKRLITERGRETFSVLLSNICITETAEDMHYIYGKYHKEVFGNYDVAFPVVSRPLKGKQPTPWMTQRIKQCVKKKAKLYKSYLKGTVSREEYTYFKNRVTALIRRVKALYYSKLFLENANDCKMVWSTINNILSRRKNPELKQVMANGIILLGDALANFANEYFVSIAATLSNVLPNTIVFTCFSPPVVASCFFRPASLSEVICVIKKLKNKGNKILDIHPSIIKENIFSFGNHFMLLYNISLVKAVFPNMLKIARVSPAFKSGQTDLIDNYRPISSLPVFSKIFERLTLDRMESFISHHSILTPCQFGFRRGKNTSLAVTRLVSLIVQAYNQKFFSACFFLDLRKAFDTVNHDLLIKKLEHYGFRGQCSNYMRSYYDNRKQHVYINGFNSSDMPVVNGVPQGSILGPLCFSLYINDMPLAVKEEVILFVDDAVFIIMCHTLAGLYKKINELFNDLTGYLNMNRLIPNSNKSKLMMFRSRLTAELPSFSFGGEEIEWVPEYKYLGMTITNNLNYSKHINNIALNIS